MDTVDMSKPEVIIVGGGLAGLCCARRLQQAGVSFQIFEASDDVGGRVRTDEQDGFLLDRGFQVFLTAYPESRAVLDYNSLELTRFSPGAMIRFGGKFHRFADPWRNPRHVLSTAVGPIGTTLDKLRIARLRSYVCRPTLQEIHERDERTTIDALKKFGFSPRMIERFFRPFLSGVFLERDLLTSSRLFEFVFRMFATGDAVLPAYGMGQIPKQIADALPGQAIRTNTAVDSIQGTDVWLTTGERVSADRVVVACEAPVTARLLSETPPASSSVTCLYFTADRAPVAEPVLMLNAEGEGPVNNLCIPSQISDTYAPKGRALISATVLGVPNQALESDVRDQLKEWFGRSVDSWSHLRSYHIPFALPAQRPPALSPVAKSVVRREGVFVCGDHLDTASINGAMRSGRRAAETLLAELKVETVSSGDASA